MKEEISSGWTGDKKPIKKKGLELYLKNYVKKIQIV